MSDINNGAPVPPEGMSQAARQEAADAAYGRTHNADAAAASMNAGKAREAEAEAKKARKEAEAAEKAAIRHAMRRRLPSRPRAKATEASARRLPAVRAVPWQSCSPRRSSHPVRLLAA